MSSLSAAAGGAASQSVGFRVTGATRGQATQSHRRHGDPPYVAAQRAHAAFFSARPGPKPSASRREVDQRFVRPERDLVETITSAPSDAQARRRLSTGVRSSAGARRTRRRRAKRPPSDSASSVPPTSISQPAKSPPIGARPASEHEEAHHAAAQERRARGCGIALVFETLSVAQIPTKNRIAQAAATDLTGASANNPR